MTRWQRLRTWAWTTKGKVILSIVLVLVLFRLALPTIVKTVVNDRLARLDGYAGRVLDVDISLWRGAYTLDDLMIERIDRSVPTPFVQCEQIDISIEWLALFHGKIVSEIITERPILHFVGGSTPQTGSGTDWRQAVDDLVPITINHFAVHDGEIHYHDFSSRPTVDVVAGSLEIEATGLSTHRDDSNELPAHVDIRGRVQRSGELHAALDVDPLNRRPTFDLALAVESLAARELNRFTRAYADIDAEQGQFYVYSQIRSRDGHFTGYVKPMVEHLSLFHFGESGDLDHQLADAFVQVAEDLFENHGTDRFATRVDVSGSFDEPGIDPFQAVIGVLENTFIRAFQHGLDRPREAWEIDHSHSPVRVHG